MVGTNRRRIDDSLSLLRAASPDETEHTGMRLDVTLEDDMRRMADMVVEIYGRIDVLIASAGIGKKADSDRVLPHSTAELPLDEWQAVLGVNLDGTFLSNRAVLPAMTAQGRGHIINIGSSTTPAGLRGTPYAPAYCASKFAMVGLSEALSAEVARSGIRVQVVFPGPVTTPLVDQTLLARPFGGEVSADHFSDAVLSLLDQPVDAVTVHPHILPFRGAFKRGRRA